MKQYFIVLSVLNFDFCLYSQEYQEQQNESNHQLFAEQQESKKVALEIVAALSGNIADLVISLKNEKNPEMIKSSCVGLVCTMTEVIALIVQKVQIARQKRDNLKISGQQYQDEMRLIGLLLAQQIIPE